MTLKKIFLSCGLFFALGSIFAVPVPAQRYFHQPSQRYMPPPRRMVARPVPPRSDIRRDELSKRIEQRRSELRREDRENRRKIEPRSRGRK